MNPPIQPGAPDADLYAFLQRLDAAEDIEVSDWEARFIESNLARGDKGAPIFSNAQRVTIDQMIRRHDYELTREENEKARVA